MDFQNVNLLNARLNKFSGNLLPMTSDDSLFPVTWRIYSAVIWLIEAILASTIIPTILFLPTDKALDNATITITLITEISFILMQMHVHRDLLIQLIRKLNEILHTEDKTMKIIVRSTLKPVEIMLKSYFMVSLVSTIMWCSVTFAVIFKKKYFLYEDYRLPIMLSQQPFSIEIFLLGNFIASIAAIYLFIKRIALDVYTINLVLLVTAQYRYIAVKLAMIFRENIPQNYNEFGNEYSMTDSSTILKMKALCRHHNAVIQIMLILKKLVSPNMSLIYLTNVFIFCFLDVMLISSVLSSSFLSAIIVIMYMLGDLTQLYILCFCINQLLNASVELTDEAFHEKWYQFGSSLKHMFRMMIMANNLECKLSVSEMLNLSLPSYMTILNQSYSIALLFLRLK